MAPDPQFCLRWNNFQTNITSQFETLRQDEDFVDVTLACEGKSVKAHKVVLSACSPYFKELFKNNPCKHPIIILRDVQWCHLCALVEFMYAGVVNVSQAELPTFLRTAESLHILGLTDAPRLHKDGKIIKDISRKSTASALAASATPSSATPTNTDTGEDDDADAQSGSPSSSPPPPKREKRSDKGDERVAESSEGHNSVDGLVSEQMDDGVDSLPSVLEQHSRSGLVITPSQQQQQCDLDQSYNDELAEMLEPKTEVPDYSSDGETRNDVNAYLEHGAFVQMQDIMAGPSSQGASDGTGTETDQVALRKLHSLDPRPCPICQRMYSNLSNLRQHMRLIHIPQSVECPLCSRSFKTKLYLRRHLLSYHEMLSKQPGGTPPPPPHLSAPLPPSQLHISPVLGPAAAAAAASMPPPPQPYMSVEEELKRTYLQSPHKSRALPNPLAAAGPSAAAAAGHGVSPTHSDSKQDKDLSVSATSHSQPVAPSASREQSQQQQPLQQQQQQQQQQQPQIQQHTQQPPAIVSSPFPFPSNLLYASATDYMRPVRFAAEAAHQAHLGPHPHTFPSPNRLGYHNSPYSGNS